MSRNKLAIVFGSAGVLGLVGAGVGVLHVPQAVSQPSAAVTPKMQAPAEARALSRAFAGTAKALQPSVVRIDVETERKKVARGGEQPDRRNVPPELERLFERFFGEGFEMPAPGPNKGTGSGVVMDAVGNILTNSHVVENASKVTVTFADGRELSAKVIGHDKNTDVAVIRLDSPPKDLVAARIGDSTKVEVGEWVLAVGSPLGLDQSVTAGIISGKGKVGTNVTMSGRRVREYIQTDAKINPGNSGGPLVNLDGEVIGINTLINMGPGGAYGFAIPINQARRVAQALVAEGRMRHAWLGIMLGDVKDGALIGHDGKPAKVPGNPKSLPAKGAWVQQVVPKSPAAKAGVHAGDVISTIDGQPIARANDVIDYVSSKAVGQKVQLAVQRDGRPAQMHVTLGDLDDMEKLAQNGQGDGQGGASPEGKQDRVGLGVQTLTPDMTRFFGLGPEAKGAAVTDVVPGSRAARAGLRADDVIIEVNRKPVTTAEEVIAALQADPKGSHILRVRRSGAALYLTIPKG